MKVLLTGGTGQLGSALQRTAPEGLHIFAPSRDDFDLSKPSRLGALVARAAPDVLINAGAYTAVDRAESEANLARAINADAVIAMAEAMDELGGRLVQISTDFVFDGRSSQPYGPDDAKRPLSVYGKTKSLGEDGAGKGDMIVRASWVYGAGHSNFVTTMLRLMRERDELSVVSDQIGAPTWANGLAEAVWGLIGRGAQGIFHHSDSGSASWYDFAVAIQEEALSIGLLDREVPIRPIETHEYPTPAVRPAFSRLDCSKTSKLLGEYQAPWRQNLRMMLMEEQTL